MLEKVDAKKTAPLPQYRYVPENASRSVKM